MEFICSLHLRAVLCLVASFLFLPSIEAGKVADTVPAETIEWGSGRVVEAAGTIEGGSGRVGEGVPAGTIEGGSGRAVQSVTVIQGYIILYIHSDETNRVFPSRLDHVACLNLTGQHTRHKS